MRTFVRAVSAQRGAVLERAFGSELIPVKAGRPRLAEGRDGGVWVYDVDLGALLPGQVDRLGGYVAQQWGMSYAEVRGTVLNGVVIRADEVEVVAAGAYGSAGRLRLWGRRLVGTESSAVV